MRTKLSVCAASLAESAWLTSLAAIPVFFNPHSVRIFDEDKALLLRSLALLIAAASLVWIVETGRRALEHNGRSFWRLPLVRPALVLTGVYLAATIFSIDPMTSWWGAYVRAQGLYTWGSYVIIFMALLLLVRERTQIERAVTVVLLSSVPVAVYGVCQHFGLDPIRWAIDTQTRVIGTAGNAIFIGAYIIMVVPLTIARLIEQLGAVRRRDPQRTSERAAAVVLLLAYAVLLALQLLTLLYSESRGPFLGLAAGLTCFFVVYASQRRRQMLTFVTVTAISAATLFLVVFNLPGSPIASWRALPYVGRIGQLLEVGGGSGKVRVLIWEGATRLLAAHPERLLFGHGPETMFVAYTPYYPPELAHYERRGVTPDRSHNESFDVVITTGLAGLVAGLVVYVALFAHALGWLGMATSQRERATVIGMMIGGASLGVAMPYVIDGSARFAGVGLPVGMLVGLLSYVLGRALTRSEATAAGSDDLLLIGLVSAIVAHFVEVHFGIAITVTRLYFWTYIALIVVLGMPLLRRDPAGDAAPTLLLAGERLVISPTVGLLLALLWYGFYRSGLDLRLAVPTLAAVFGSTWLMGAGLLGAEQDQRGRRLAGLGGYATTTAGLLLLFVSAQAWWADWRPDATPLTPDILRTVAWRTAQLPALLFAFVLLLVLLHAAIHVLRQRPLPAPWARGRATMALALALVAVAVVAAAMTNLRPLRADVVAKQAQRYEARQQYQAARLAYEDARRLDPQETIYAVGLGRVLWELARRSVAEDLLMREQALGRAEEVLAAAWTRAPLNPDHPRNLAKLHRTWALLTAGAERATHVQRSNELYERAAARSLHNAELRNEWALLYLEHNDATGALDLIDQSLAIDDRYTTTWSLRARAHLALDQREAALADYDRALALDPTMLSSWSGKALVLAELGRTDEAIATNQRALAVAPDDLITHRNLAILFQQKGDLQRAREYAESALALAQGDERARLEQFIRELD